MKQNEFKINISKTKDIIHKDIEGATDDIISAILTTLCDITKKIKISPSVIISTYLFGLAKMDEMEAEDDN